MALYMIFPFYVFLAAFVTLALSLLTKRNLMNTLFLVFFLGFQPNIFLNLKNHKIEVSRHTAFYETHFPYKLKDEVNKSPNNLSLPIPSSYASTYDFSYDNYTVEPISITAEPISVAPMDQLISNPPRLSTRPRCSPAYLEEFHTDLPSTQTVSTRYPISIFLSYNVLSSNFKHVISSFTSHTEPKSYEEASQHPCWKQAMEAELEALFTNNTWQLVPLPPGKKSIGYYWVYKIKNNSDDTIDRYKARLVAEGYIQLEGLDFLDTF